MTAFTQKLQIALVASFVATSCRAAEPIKSFDRLTLERSACFGTCPVYRIVVFADGRVEYEGKKFVKTVGKQEKRLSSGEVSRLVAAIVAVDYLKLRDRYRSSEDGCPAVWTDHPTVETSVQIGKTLKTVEHYYGCKEKDTDSPGATYPVGLEAFEDSVDQIVKTEEWVGSREERLRAPTPPSVP